MYDVKDIAVGTKKEDELFEYADVPSYYKENIDDYEDIDKGLER